MLEKLRSRHPVDVPADEWGRRKLFVVVLGGLAVLFVLVPLAVSLLAGLTWGGGINRRAVIAVAAGFGFLVLVLVAGALRGKPGWER